MEDERFTRQKIQTHRLSGELHAKWPGVLLEEGYVPLPKRLLRSLAAIFTGPHAIQDLTAVLAVVDFRRPQLTRLPSEDFLAFLAGLSVEAFRDSLHRLSGRGLVEVRGTPDRMDVRIDGLFRAIESATSATTAGADAGELDLE
jgi:hypothetical protein